MFALPPPVIFSLRPIPSSLALLCAALLSLAGPGLVRAQGAATATEAAGPRFDILEFVVEGDTLLGAATIERAVYEFMGPQRSVTDVDNARKALEKAYQDAGFLSVSVVIPPQRVDSSGGEVRLKVIQAPVDKLRVTGAQFHLPSQVKEAVPTLAPGNVPNFNEMQQELAQLSRASADREITPILAAGEQPGTMNVELKVQDSLPLHGYAELNGKQTLNTEAGRLEAGINYDNLFQRGYSLGFNWVYSPRRPSQANIQSLSYHFPFGGVGDRMYLLLVHSDSDTPTPVGGASVSRGNTARLRWRDELPSLEGINHGLTWGVTARDLHDRSLDKAGVSTESPSLRYATFNVAYDLQLSSTLQGRSSSLQAEMSVSPPGLNRRTVDCFGTQREQFACKRKDSSPGFQVLSLSLSHREPLGRWSLQARLQAQVADQPLVSAEQVVYGGQDSVRGYYEGEQAGDLGAALRLELGTPNWAPADRLTLSGLAFFDSAAVKRLYATSSEVATATLASAGLGLRLGTTFGLQATLTWAKVLRDTTRLGSDGRQQPVTGSKAGRGQRVDLSLRQSF